MVVIVGAFVVVVVFIGGDSDGGATVAADAATGADCCFCCCQNCLFYRHYIPVMKFTNIIKQGKWIFVIDKTITITITTSMLATNQQIEPPNITLYWLL